MQPLEPATPPPIMTTYQCISSSWGKGFSQKYVNYVLNTQNCHYCARDNKIMWHLQPCALQKNLSNLNLKFHNPLRMVRTARTRDPADRFASILMKWKMWICAHLWQNAVLLRLAVVNLFCMFYICVFLRSAVDRKVSKLVQFKVNCSIKKFRVEARAQTCNVLHDTFNQLSHELAQLTLHS